MYWTLELASYLEDDRGRIEGCEFLLITTPNRCANGVLPKTLQDLEDEGEIYENIEEICPTIPSEKISCLTKMNIKQKCRGKVYEFPRSSLFFKNDCDF